MQAWVRDAILPDSRHALNQLHIGSAAALLRPVIYIKGHRRAACWLVRNVRVCVPVGTCTSTPPACHSSPTCHREETAQLPGQLARQPNCQAAGGAQSPQQTRGASFGPVGLPLAAYSQSCCRRRSISHTEPTHDHCELIACKGSIQQCRNCKPAMFY